ncbi:LysR family transcriptional regulator [Providencia huaxiensis]|uniref:LysR family transcriptional regulator n=1 Tax=Providencia huaxiensis TaxID=2027290 RepID=A0A8I2ALG9_9GAMM|nr:MULTISPECIES: LysR family transcriptional regulator [Providencia]MBN6361431.1 LysR family transcriptional regulator [Providencia huaxiensis]MBQ0267498.1 LysR family transcriptional regulator [Providencia huaxiensis]MBQ0533854.1 LysR family transcriptional regulator [Providencia huaxiensis]MBQ0588548.1 LysR family transcriptional regulator [Providencia huaxiensis]MCD2527794.1 LysR family transcriptional regulator [Providencia huaxiensis]
MAVDLNLLKVFIAVATQGSFANAAKLLSMPTSNVSRYIKQLEQQLNSQLIERTTRQMRLTETGNILFEQSQKLVSELEQVVVQICYPQQITGTLRLTIPSESGSLLLADLLAKFALSHPQLNIHCDTQLIPQDVISDDIDLLLTFHRGHLEDSSYHSRLVKSWQSVVVAAPQLIEKVGKPRSYTDLASMPCISSLSALQGQPWIFIDSSGLQKKVIINSNYRVNSGALAYAAAMNGIGYAILALEACAEQIKQKKLVRIEFDEVSPAPIELRAVYASRSALSPKIDAFLQYLLANI